MKLIKILLAIFCLTTLVIYLFPRTWELDLIATLQQNGNATTIAFFRFISDAVFKTSLSVGIPVLLIITSFIRPSPILRKKAILVLLTLALGGIFSYGIKKLVREPRPYEVDTRIAQLGEGGGYGFPSGHVIEAAAASTALIFFWTEWYVIIPAICWIILMMCSRIFLGVHDPGDVMGGVSLGLLSFLLVYKASEVFFPARTRQSLQ